MRLSRQSPPSIRVRVDSDVVQALLEQWRGAGGAEPCGVLFGRRDEQGVELCEVHALPNLHPRPASAFLLDPRDQVSARAVARSKGLEVVALWHGHLRGPPLPSREDAEGMERAVELGAAPDVVVLVGTGRGDVPVLRAWRVRGHLARELHLRVSGA